MEVILFQKNYCQIRAVLKLYAKAERYFKTGLMGKWLSKLLMVG